VQWVAILRAKTNEHISSSLGRDSPIFKNYS
jgi:hypothetical protein